MTAGRVAVEAAWAAELRLYWLSWQMGHPKTPRLLIRKPLLRLFNVLGKDKKGEKEGKEEEGKERKLRGWTVQSNQL